MRVPVANLAESRAVLRQGKTVSMDNLFAVPKHPPLIEALMAEGLCSYITVPLIAEEDLIGMLTLGGLHAAAAEERGNRREGGHVAGRRHSTAAPTEAGASHAR